VVKRVISPVFVLERVPVAVCSRYYR
jgi:hypothetical protein